jgi:hypothetical protein
MTQVTVLQHNHSNMKWKYKNQLEQIENSHRHKKKIENSHGKHIFLNRNKARFLYQFDNDLVKFR